MLYEYYQNVLKVEGYHDYWSSGDTKGYSGTGYVNLKMTYYWFDMCVHFRIYSKEKPLNVTYGIGLSNRKQQLCLLLFVYFSFPKASQNMTQRDV